MFGKLISKIENSSIGLWNIVLLFYIAVFFRAFLENYANIDNQSHIANMIDIFFHYSFWFFGIFLLAIIIIRILTKEKINKIRQLAAFSSFLILLPPILDLIVNRGGSIRYIFIVGDIQYLIKSFFTFLGGGSIGLGIRAEVFFFLLLFGYYLFYKTKKIRYSVIGVVILYSIIFIFLTFPVIVFALHNLILDNLQEVNAESVPFFYYLQEPVNAVTNSRTFIVDKNNFEPLEIQDIKNQYAITLSIIFLIIDVLLLAWCFFLYSSQKFIAVLKNFRYLRIIYYFLFVLLGIYLGISFSGKTPVNSLFDLLSFISLFLAILFAWLFSVWENDEADIEIDKISNQDRPLVRKELSETEWRNIKYIFLFLSLSFAFLTGFYSFIFILLFISIYHIYSVWPLRLKRFLGISSFLIAANALIATFMGFFLSAGTENLRAFPAKYLFGILGIFFLIENIKNLKDTDGDKKNNIKTLPVVLGRTRSKLILGIFAFFSALMVPFIVYPNLLTFFTAILFGLLLFFLINRRDFNEKHVFYVFIAYFVLILAFMLYVG